VCVECKTTIAKWVSLGI